MKKNVLIIVAILAALFGFHKLVEYQERFNCSDAVVTVKAGDTMWTIAHANCTGNVQGVVDRLVNEYGLVIKVGQKIQLP